MTDIAIGQRWYFRGFIFHGEISPPQVYVVTDIYPAPDGYDTTVVLTHPKHPDITLRAPHWCLPLEALLIQETPL